MNTRFLLTLMFLSVACATPKISPVAPPAPASLLELRLVQRSPNGADAFKFGDSVLYLARPPLLSDSGITAVRPSVSRSGELLLDISYSHAARERLAAGTQRVGDHLAVVVESRVAVVAPIASSIGRLGSFVTGTGLTGADADRFAARVKARWPAEVPARNPFAHMAETRKAIIAKDTARAFALLDSIRALTPDHPNYTYLRAHANGMAGRRDQARSDIQRLLKWDPRYARAALRDTSVASLRNDFAHLDSLAKLAERPVSNASVWATISEPDLVPEGTAWDSRTRSVLIGSLNKYKIIAIGADGTVTDRVPSETMGLRSVAGIHVDSTRGVLWVASNPRFDTPADSRQSALFAFDAASGALKTLVSPGHGKHFLNDITTGPDGTVYVTDSQDGIVWFAAPDSSQLRPLTALGRVLSPNGITISTDGRVLFVADVDHIRALEISSGRVWRVALPDTVNVSGIDGLAFHRNELIAHHPLSNWRIARYSLDSSWQRITGRRLIDANTPDGRTSTTGEVVGDDYIYIGNSQIDRMNAKTIDAATMDPVRIYWFPLLPGR